MQEGQEHFADSAILNFYLTPKNSILLPQARSWTIILWLDIIMSWWDSTTLPLDFSFRAKLSHGILISPLHPVLDGLSSVPIYICWLAIRRPAPDKQIPLCARIFQRKRRVSCLFSVPGQIQGFCWRFGSFVVETSTSPSSLWSLVSSGDMFSESPAVQSIRRRVSRR